MKFGLLFGFRNAQPWAKPFPQVYWESFELIRQAEGLGYDSVWLTEHHFIDDGYSPSVMATAAAVATQTSKVKIGTYVLLLPMYHPVRLAEDAATVDIISNGRLIFGAGVGYRPQEFEALGIPIEERGGLMDEGLEVIIKCWTEDSFSYNGKHFHLKNVAMTPKPVQKPRPPILIGRPEKKRMLERAARLGVEGLAGRPGLELMPYWLDRLKHYGRDPAQVVYDDLRFIYLDTDRERALREVRPHAEWVHSRYNRWFASVGVPVMTRTIQEDFVIGDPAYCIRRLEEFLKFNPQAELDTLISHMAFPGMPLEKTQRSVELFATKVAPYFREKGRVVREGP